VTCPEGQARYQATHYITVNGGQMDVWEVRCLPATAEVSQLVTVHMLVPEAADGSFPSPEVVPYRCCGG
jgi:hypothetical protein